MATNGFLGAMGLMVAVLYKKEKSVSRFARRIHETMLLMAPMDTTPFLRRGAGSKPWAGWAPYKGGLVLCFVKQSCQKMLPMMPILRCCC